MIVNLNACNMSLHAIDMLFKLWFCACNFQGQSWDSFTKTAPLTKLRESQTSIHRKLREAKTCMKIINPHHGVGPEPEDENHMIALLQPKRVAHIAGKSV